MKSLRIILIIVFALVFAFAGWQLLGIMGDYKAGQDSYEELGQFVSFSPAPPKPTDSTWVGEGDTEPELEEPDDTLWPVVDFEELAAINPDVVGWIFVEGTNINYPVVQGKDNSYYLNHLFNGWYNDSGCIFLDAANAPDFSDPHSIIYGHHMNDKSMFYTLDNYKSQNFYNEHSLALLVTPTHKYKIRIFSAYIADVKSDAWETDFSGKSYKDWLDSVVEASALESNFVPEEDDRVLTMSTCSYEFLQAKLVVHGYVERVFENVPQIDEGK